MSKQITSKSETETIQIAQDLANTLQSPTSNLQLPILIFLTGTLGAGKSVFARAFIRTLTQDPALTVPSPTFTLLQTYDSPAGSIYHYDLYRLEDPEEIYEIGWEHSLSEGISLIEWPDRLAGIAPTPTLDITIEQADNGNERTITIIPTNTRAELC